MMTALDTRWAHLYRYARPRLERWACASYLEGLDRLGHAPLRAPDIERLSALIARETPWRLVRARGEVPARRFFELLANHEFPIVHELRPLEQLFASVEPDLWHETIGHIPLLFDAQTSRLYQELGLLARDHFDETCRLYWYLAEYGVIREGRASKILGAGLQASPLGADSLEHHKVKIRPFSVEGALAADYNPYKFQRELFEIEDIDDALARIRSSLTRDRTRLRSSFFGFFRSDFHRSVSWLEKNGARARK